MYVCSQESSDVWVSECGLGWLGRGHWRQSALIERVKLKDAERAGQQVGNKNNGMEKRWKSSRKV